jgi:hypothetical protein
MVLSSNSGQLGRNRAGTGQVWTNEQSAKRTEAGNWAETGQKLGKNWAETGHFVFCGLWTGQKPDIATL